MKDQHYFSKKDIVVNNIQKIESPVFSSRGVSLTRPVICIFYPDGRLFSLMSLTLFKIKKKRGVPIIENEVLPGFYCELRQVL